MTKNVNKIVLRLLKLINFLAQSNRNICTGSSYYNAQAKRLLTVQAYGGGNQTMEHKQKTTLQNG